LKFAADYYQSVIRILKNRAWIFINQRVPNRGVPALDQLLENIRYNQEEEGGERVPLSQTALD
jgi:hypothetical protein